MGLGERCTLLCQGDYLGDIGHKDSPLQLQFRILIANLGTSGPCLVLLILGFRRRCFLTAQ